MNIIYSVLRQFELLWSVFYRKSNKRLPQKSIAETSVVIGRLRKSEIVPVIPCTTSLVYQSSLLLPVSVRTGR